MTNRGALYQLAGIGEIGVDVRTNYTCPLHTHDAYSVGIFRGEAQIFCRGRNWSVDWGSIAILEPGEAHRGTIGSRTCTQVGILPDSGFMVETFGAPRPFRIPHPIIVDVELAESLSRAAADRDSDGLRKLLSDLFRHWGEPADRFIHASSEKRVSADITRSVAATSRAQGLSRSHFSRKLRAQTGLPPRDMRRQLRVARARALIEGGEDLASAALASGFADQAHMSRQLRSLLGVTPSALRKPRD